MKRSICLFALIAPLALGLGCKADEGGSGTGTGTDGDGGDDGDDGSDGSDAGDDGTSGSDAGGTSDDGGTDTGTGGTGGTGGTTGTGGTDTGGTDTGTGGTTGGTTGGGTTTGVTTSGGVGGDYPPCEGNACPEDWECIVDDQGGIQGDVCGDDCVDEGDCADAPGGAAATPACVDIPDGQPSENNRCILVCTEDGDCPDGMQCGEIQLTGGPGNTTRICVWPWAADNGPWEACGLGCDTDLSCIVDDQGGIQGNHCSESCTDAGDCSSPPGGGDAPVVCEDIPDGTPETDFRCLLDCDDGNGDVGADCPTGWECGQIDVVNDAGNGTEPLRICVIP